MGWHDPKVERRCRRTCTLQAEQEQFEKWGGHSYIHTHNIYIYIYIHDVFFHAHFALCTVAP